MKSSEAIDRVFRLDQWLFITIPLGLALSWLFFLPILWRVILLILAGVVCSFTVPCAIGNNVREIEIGVMLASHLASLYFVGWYGVYLTAFLKSSGYWNKLVGGGLLVLSPAIFLGGALILGLLSVKLGLHTQELWAFYDKWTPISAWKITR